MQYRDACISVMWVRECHMGALRSPQGPQASSLVWQWLACGSELLHRTGSDVNDTVVHASDVFVVSHAGMLLCTGCVLTLYCSQSSISVHMPAVLHATTIAPHVHRVASWNCAIFHATQSCSESIML